MSIHDHASHAGALCTMAEDGTCVECGVAMHDCDDCGGIGYHAEACGHDGEVCRMRVCPYCGGAYDPENQTSVCSQSTLDIRAIEDADGKLVATLRGDTWTLADGWIVDRSDPLWDALWDAGAGLHRTVPGLWPVPNPR